MRAKGMCVGKILSRFLLALGFSLVLTGRCFAICNIGEYNYCELDDQYAMFCQCGCIPCGNGQTSDGHGEVNNCVTSSINNSGCYAAYCQEYNDTCPSNAGTGMKCKAVGGCESPCQKYEVCNPSNGNITTTISGQCHLEGDSCYPNTRACNKFDVKIIGGIGNWTCKKSDQTGDASWNPSSNKWDVSGCQCTKNSIVANGCDSGHVKHTPLPQVDTATSSIIYIQNERYCMHCAAGTVPKIASAYENISGDGSGLLDLFLNLFDSLKVWFTSNNNGDWGVWQCENVKKPYYSPGCDINFNETYDAAVSACKKSCDQYLETKSDGATNADACKPDDTEYTDGIGTFTLGTNSCSN